MRLTFAPAAARDIEGIADYIAAENPAAARRFVAALKDRCARLAHAPHGGRSRPELAAGLRSVAFKRYVIFYTVDDAIRIERVLHGSRDIDAIFTEDEI